jgi:hypothetical protein
MKLLHGRSAPTCDIPWQLTSASQRGILTSPLSTPQMYFTRSKQDSEQLGNALRTERSTGYVLLEWVCNCSANSVHHERCQIVRSTLGDRSVLNAYIYRDANNPKSAYSASGNLVPG